MRSSDVVAGNTIFASDLNKLRDDAFASSWLLAHEQTVPDLTLKVENGTIYFGNTPIVFAGGNSPSFTAPATNPRIDILSLDTTGTLIRTAGTEAGSPVAPALPDGNIPIAQIYNRVGQTSIKDTDDTTNGYIQKDLRIFIKQTNGETFYKPTTVDSSVENGMVVFSPNIDFTLTKDADVIFSTASSTTGTNVITSTSGRYAYIFKTNSLTRKIGTWQFPNLSNNSVTGTVQFKLYAVDSNLKPTGSALFTSSTLGTTGVNPAMVNPVTVNTNVSPNTWYAMVIDGSGLGGFGGSDGLQIINSIQNANTKSYVSTDGGSTWSVSLITNAEWTEIFYNTNTVYPAISSYTDSIIPKYLGVYNNGQIQTRGIVKGYSGLSENLPVYIKNTPFRLYCTLSRGNVTAPNYYFAGNSKVGFKLVLENKTKLNNLFFSGVLDSLSDGVDTLTVKLCTISGGLPDETNVLFTETVTYNADINNTINEDSPIFFPFTNCPIVEAGDYAVVIQCSNATDANARTRITDVGTNDVQATLISKAGIQSENTLHTAVFYYYTSGSWNTVTKGVKFLFETTPIDSLAQSGDVFVGVATSSTSFDIK